MTNTTDGENRNDPDAVRIQRLAEGAKKDLEEFTKLAARANNLEKKFRIMDRLVILPLVVLVPTVTVIAALFFLYQEAPLAFVVLTLGLFFSAVILLLRKLFT